MYAEIRKDRVERLLALRRQYPSEISGVVDAKGTPKLSADRMSGELFEHEVSLLKGDIRKSGLAPIIRTMAVLIGVFMLCAFVYHKGFYGAALFVLVGGGSMYFSRKQKNYEKCAELDRELLGRE